MSQRHTAMEVESHAVLVSANVCQFTSKSQQIRASFDGPITQSQFLSDLYGYENRFYILQMSLSGIVKLGHEKIWSRHPKLCKSEFPTWEILLNDSME